MAAPDSPQDPFHDLPIFSTFSGDEDKGSDDETCAFRLQFQEVVMASVTINNPATVTLTAEIEQEQEQEPVAAEIEQEPVAADIEQEPSMSLCEICTETKPSDLIFTVPNCSHRFCNDCVGKHIQAKLESNTHTIVCPAANCGEPIEFEVCGSIVPRNVMEKWGELLCESSIDASQRFYCPFKDCSALMFRDEGEAEEIMEAECGACHRLFCARCNMAWHPDVGCEEFQRMDENERAREDLMMKSLAREKKWSRCPLCKYIVEKTEGCNHMTCRCHFQFCYICGANWTNNHGGCVPRQQM